MQDQDKARLEDLEVRLAHQEKMIVDLNEIVTAQWKRLDFLEQQMRQMREEMRNAAPPAEGEEPPPPHY
jgi:SlyX protein